MKTIFTSILLSFSLNILAQKTIMVGKHKVQIKTLKASDFNPLGVWEVFHREWEFNCDYEFKGKTNNELNYFHIGEQLIIEPKKIYSNSTMFSSFFETYKIKLQENMSANLFMQVNSDPRDCTGKYYSKRFGDNLLAIDIDCKFVDGYRLGADGNIPLERYWVLNEDVVFRLLNYSIVFFKRNKNAKIGFPQDKDGYHVMKSDYENHDINFEIPKEEFLPKSFLKIKLVNSIIDLKLITLYRYLSFFCSDGTYDTSDEENYIYGPPKQNIKDDWLYAKPWTSLSNRAIYIPIDSLVTSRLDLTLKYNPKFERNSLTITKFKTIASKTGKIISEKSIIYSDLHKQSKVYLIKNDSVIIIDEESDFYYVEFQGEKNTRGWIKKSDVD